MSRTPKAIPQSIRNLEGLLSHGALIWFVSILLSHLFFPPWPVAAFASVSMNCVYVLACILSRDGNHLLLELLVTLSLIVVTVYGYQTSSAMLLAGAIVGHGIWDLTKHTCCTGVPFFGWYLSSCAIFDVLYASVLFQFLL